MTPEPLAIIGLDLALTSSGVAYPDGTTGTLKARAGDDNGARLNQLGTDLERLLAPHRIDLAILEGYAIHAVGIVGMLRRAEWIGCVRRDLRRRRIPTMFVFPHVLKSWATNNGNATKPAMVKAAHDAGGHPANDDEADAYLLRAVGELYLNDVDLFNDPKDRARRLHVANGMTWADPTRKATT